MHCVLEILHDCGPILMAIFSIIVAAVLMHYCSLPTNKVYSLRGGCFVGCGR